jgi:N-acetylglutamate synthase-like GNAT family acetyltransferase
VEKADIREAKREEIPQIVTLYNLMWVERGSPLDIKIGENIYDQMRGEGKAMYVVVVDGRVVGCFMLLLQKGDLARCILENVVVHPRYQRRGVGSEIIEFVTDRCREAQCRQIVASSRERREESSGFYESLGFERRGYGFVKNIR